MRKMIDRVEDHLTIQYQSNVANKLEHNWHDQKETNQ